MAKWELSFTDDAHKTCSFTLCILETPYFRINTGNILLSHFAFFFFPSFKVELKLIFLQEEDRLAH